MIRDIHALDQFRRNPRLIHMNCDVQYILAITFGHLGFPDDPIAISELRERQPAILIRFQGFNDFGSAGIHEHKLNAFHGLSGGISLLQGQFLRNVHKGFCRLFRIDIFLIYGNDVFFAGKQISIRGLGFTNRVATLFYMRETNQAIFVRNCGHDLFAILIEQAKLRSRQYFFVLGKLQHQDFRGTVVDDCQRFLGINEGSIHSHGHPGIITNISRQRIFLLDVVFAVGHLFKGRQALFIRDSCLDQIVGLCRIEAETNTGQRLIALIDLHDIKAGVVVRYISAAFDLSLRINCEGELRHAQFVAFRSQDFLVSVFPGKYGEGGNITVFTGIRLTDDFAFFVPDFNQGIRQIV